MAWRIGIWDAHRLGCLKRNIHFPQRKKFSVVRKNRNYGISVNLQIVRVEAIEVSGTHTGKDSWEFATTALAFFLQCESNIATVQQHFKSVNMNKRHKTHFCALLSIREIRWSMTTCAPSSKVGSKWTSGRPPIRHSRMLSH
jgi:hypothetical protein